MNLSSRYERPDAPLRHRTEINHNRATLTQYLQKCQIALEIPDENEEADGELPRMAFKDHLCRYHSMARQDELTSVISDFNNLLDNYLPLTGGTLTGDLIISDAKLRIESGYSFVDVDINEFNMFLYGGNHGGSRSLMRSGSLSLSHRDTDHGHSSTLNTQYLTFNPAAYNDVVDGSWRIGLCRANFGSQGAVDIRDVFLAERYNGDNWESVHVFGETGAQKPLYAGGGLLMDFTNENTYDGSALRTLCVAFGTGEYQAARGNHTHNQLHTHENLHIINEITQADIDRWNSELDVSNKLNRGGDETGGAYKWNGRHFFCTAGQYQKSAMKLAYFDVDNEWGIHEINSLMTGYNGQFLKIDGSRFNWSRIEIEDVYNLDNSLYYKQDKLVAGDNIQINGNRISATGGGSGGTPNVGDGRINLKIGQGASAVTIGTFTVNQNGNTDIVLDSSHSGNSGNEANLLSNIPHKIEITAPQSNGRYTVGGDGPEIPSNKTFLVIEHVGSGINNPAISVWTSNAIERAFYIVNKTDAAVQLNIKATENGTEQTINIAQKRAAHVLLGSLGVSNLIGQAVDYRGIS